MTTDSVHPEGSFSAEFLNRLNRIEDRAHSAGITLTDVCRDSGTARATPNRWRKRVPLTVSLIDKMEGIVAAAEQKKADATE